MSVASHSMSSTVCITNPPQASGGAIRAGALRGALAILGLAVAAVAAAAPPSSVPAWTMTARWPLGGAGGWDLLTVDPRTGWLYVTRGDHVEVLDTRDGKLVGRIAPSAGAHAVLIAPELERGWVSNGRGNSLTEFDARTLAVRREIAVPGDSPDAMVWDPPRRRLFVFNGKSRDLLVLDAIGGTVMTRLPMPGKPELARYDRGHVYVNIESDPGRVLRIDAATLAIDGDWALPGCPEPTGLALDASRERLYSACDNRMLAVTDATTGRPIARVPIGQGPDGAEFDPVLGVVLIPNGADGTLSVVRTRDDDYRAQPIVRTQKGARTIALDPEHGRAYLFTAEFAPPTSPPGDPPARPSPLEGTHAVLVLERR